MAARKKRKTLLQKRHLSTKHRKAISRGLKRYWRRQREEIGVPRGFKTSRQEVEPMLNRAMAIMMRDHGVDGKIDREINADLTVDWELRFAIPRNVNLRDFATDLNQVLKPMLNSWISIGVRFMRNKRMTREEWKAYEEFGGMLQVGAHFQRMTKGKIATNIIAVQSIMEKMKRKKRLKPNQIFVRVHWNLKGERPK